MHRLTALGEQPHAGTKAKVQIVSPRGKRQGGGLKSDKVGDTLSAGKGVVRHAS